MKKIALYFTLLILAGYLGVEFAQAGARVDVATTGYVNSPYNVVVGNFLTVTNCIILGESSEGHRLYGSNDYLILHGQYGELSFKDDGIHLSYGAAEYYFDMLGIHNSSNEYFATEEYVDGVTNQYSAASWNNSSPAAAVEYSDLTIQLKDSAGNNLSGYYEITYWTAQTAYGVPYNNLQGNAFTTGTEIKELTGNAMWILQTDSTGKIVQHCLSTVAQNIFVMYTSPVLKGKIYSTYCTWITAP